MFARRFLLLVGFFVVASAMIFGLSALAKYKPYGVADSQREKWESIQESIRLAEEAREQQQKGTSQAGPLQPQPRVEVPESEHDFGLLDPGIQARHTFEIRNTGNAPLALVAGDTSCKCTLSETSRELVPPGESAEITLIWNTGSEREYYRQYAVIRTNDPTKQEIELAVSGRVRTEFGFNVERFVDPQVDPGEGAQATAIFFSQMHESIEIDQVECGLAGFRAEVTPVDEDTMRELGAKSAWRLDVSTSAALDKGSFSEVVRVHARVSETESTVVKDIPFEGRVRSSISFYGAGLDSREGLDIGVVNTGKETIHKLFVKVRGNPAPTALKVSGVEPAVMQASIEPIASRPGTFLLTIRIPADAPQTIFNRESEHGYVEVCDVDNEGNNNWFPVRGAVIDAIK